MEDAVNAYFEDLTAEDLERRAIGRVLRGEARRALSMEMELFAGPLPPPAILERYAGLYPDAPRIIFTSFEAQGIHRRTLEDFVVRANARRAAQGLWAGFVVTILFLFVSAYLILNGHDVAGTILGVVDLVALAGVFVYGSQLQRKERERKAEIMSEAARGEPRPPGSPGEIEAPQTDG